MGNTYAEQVLKKKYDSRTKIDSIAFQDVGFINDIPRTVGPDGEDFTSFLELSGGIGWSGTRQAARAAAGQGAQRGNGSFQAIKNSAGAIKGEARVRQRDVERGNEGSAAALRAVAASVDGHLKNFGPMVEWMATNSSVDMRLCTITIASGVCTITSNPEHINRVIEDMTLVASTTPGTSGSLVGSGSIGYVKAVTHLGATPTFSVSPSSGGAVGTPSGWPEATTLYVFLNGVYAPSNGGAGIDGGTDGDESGFVLDTIESWNPAAGSVSLSAPFKTMVRSTNDLMAGITLTAAEVANLNILQRIEKLAVVGRSRGRWPRNRMVNAYVQTIRFNEAAQLIKREDMRMAGFALKDQGKAKTGYNYIVITCIGGEIRLEECPLYEPDVCRMLNPDDGNIHSAAGFPNVVGDIDGLKWIRDPDTDQYVLQYSAHASLRFRNPGMLAQCPLD